MLKSNLAVLMAQRGLKIADVYEKTGISKTTLMALADNKSKGVQFETIDKLCNFFNVPIEQFFIYSPFLIEFSRSDDDNGVYVNVTSGEKVEGFYFAYYSWNSKDDPLYEIFGNPQKKYDYYVVMELEHLNSNSDFTKVYDELDIWFKKVLADKLLEFAEKLFETEIAGRQGEYLCAFQIMIDLIPIAYKECNLKID